MVSDDVGGEVSAQANCDRPPTNLDLAGLQPHDHRTP